MTKKLPKVTYEYVATQLILRSVGFTTPEFFISLTKKGKLSVDVTLSVRRGEENFAIELGSIKLAYATVLNYWETWLESATKELVDDFKADKKLFYSLHAYKTMNALFESLESKDFALTDTQIATTFKPKGKNVQKRFR